MPSTSQPVTRQSLALRARQRADYQGSTFIDSSTNEDSNLVDVSLAKLHNILVGLWEDYFTSNTLIPIIANVDSYPLPADWMKLRQVFYVDTSGYRWPMRRLSLSDLTNVPINISYSSLPLGYALLGQALTLFPKPSTSQTNQLQLYYIPQYTAPVSDTDPISYAICFGWDEWVVNDVAYQFRIKANEPATEIMAEREKLEAAIKQQAIHRDASGPGHVRDTGWSGDVRSRRGSFAIK